MFEQRIKETRGLKAMVTGDLVKVEKGDAAILYSLLGDIEEVSNAADYLSQEVGLVPIFFSAGDIDWADRLEKEGRLLHIKVGGKVKEDRKEIGFESWFARQFKTREKKATPEDNLAEVRQFAVNEGIFAAVMKRLGLKEKDLLHVDAKLEANILGILAMLAVVSGLSGSSLIAGIISAVVITGILYKSANKLRGSPQNELLDIPPPKKLESEGLENGAEKSALFSSIGEQVWNGSNGSVQVRSKSKYRQQWLWRLLKIKQAFYSPYVSFMSFLNGLSAKIIPVKLSLLSWLKNISFIPKRSLLQTKTSVNEILHRSDKSEQISSRFLARKDASSEVRNAVNEILTRLKAQPDLEISPDLLREVADKHKVPKDSPDWRIFQEIIKGGIAKGGVARKRSFFSKEDIREQKIAFAMLKPDAAEYTESIIDDLSKAGFEIVLRIERERLNKEVVEKFYAEHKGKDFFASLVDYVGSGRVTLLVLKGGKEAYKQLRDIVGPFDGSKEGSLRNKYGVEFTPVVAKNKIHASDSFEGVLEEMKIVFSKKELLKVFSQEALDLIYRKPEFEIKNAGGFTRGLIKQFNGNRLDEVLKKLNIINSNEKLLSYEEVEGWRVGGAETYIAFAKVRLRDINGNEYERPFIAKAIITTPIKEVVESWLRRREILQKMGVKIPKLYAYHSGTMYLEDIPYTAKEVLNEAEGEKREILIRKLAYIAAALDTAGFRPLGFLRDLRSDGEEFYYADVGEDLGEPSGEPNEISRNQLMEIFKSDSERKLAIHYYAIEKIRQKANLNSAEPRYISEKKERKIRELKIPTFPKVELPEKTGHLPRLSYIGDINHIKKTLKATPVKEVIRSAQFKVLTNEDLDFVIRIARSKEDTANIFRSWSEFGRLEREEPEQFNKWVARVHRGKEKGTWIFKDRLQNSKAVWGVKELYDVDILEEDKDGGIHPQRVKKLFIQKKADRTLAEALKYHYQRGEIDTIREILNQIIKKTQEGNLDI